MAIELDIQKNFKGFSLNVKLKVKMEPWESWALPEAERV